MVINYYELLKDNPVYFKQFSCKELLFLNYDCPVKEKKVAKWSEHNYIYYVLSGQKVIHTPTRSWPLTKGSAVFVKKGACIVEQFFREPFCIVVFVMPDSFIKSFVQENVSHFTTSISPENELAIPIDGDEVMHAFYESVLPYFTSTITPPDNLIELKFKELLLHIIRNPNNQELTAYLQYIGRKHSSSMEQVMELNYSYNLPLEAYARLTNRSLSTFKRDFQDTYQTTPGRWLLQKRLTYACKLLATTDTPISDIAFQSGFGNNAHFSRAFRQKFGVSPLQYRKQFAESLTSTAVTPS